MDAATRRLGRLVHLAPLAASDEAATEPAELPDDGAAWESVSARMEAVSSADSDWHGPRMFKGGSYFGRQDVVEVANAAYAKYINFNARERTALHPPPSTPTPHRTPT